MEKTLAWKNGREINWASKGLRLSAMVPNGCDTTYCRGQLHDIGLVVRSVLDKFCGYTGWEAKAPAGALIVAESIDAVAMHASCYCYGSPFNGKQYADRLVSLGLTRKCADEEIARLADIFGRFYRKNARIHWNIATSEGVSYNGFEMPDGVLNVRFK